MRIQDTLEKKPYRPLNVYRKGNADERIFGLTYYEFKCGLWIGFNEEHSAEDIIDLQRRDTWELFGGSMSPPRQLPEMHRVVVMEVVCGL